MLEFRQANVSDLEGINLYRVAELIYNTDEYIYPSMVDDKEQAIKVFAEVLKDGNDCFFDWRKLFLMLKDEKVIGIIMWNKRTLKWDATVFETMAKNSGVSLPDSYQMVREEYFPSYQNEELKNAMSIINVCVYKDYQGMGLGRKMMERFMNEHKEEERFELYCLEENLPAMKLYTSLGFEIIERQRAFATDRDDIYTVKMVFPKWK